jgi:hypothetical protein
MARPFTIAQAAQNAAFLEALARSGNARLAARGIGVAISTMQHRRAGHAGLAAEWDAAVVAAHARFHAAGGKKGLAGGGATGPAGAMERDPLRTEGGEPMVVRTRSGRLQVRPAHRGKLTKAAEQLFLQALSASANVRLSAAAAGASARAFYRRRRQNTAFAREMRLALETGYSRIEAAAVMAACPSSHADDAWRSNEPPPIAPMTPEQALQLLYLHEKSVRQSWEQPHRRRRRGESEEVYLARLRAMYAAEKAREAEALAVARAIRAEDGGGGGGKPPPLPALPELGQVTGWSKAKGGARHNPDVALFGGWRMAEMKKKLGR